MSASPTSSHLDYTPFVRPMMIESTNDEVECGNEEQHHSTGTVNPTQPISGIAAPATQTQVNVALVLPRERNESIQPVAEQSVSNSQDGNQQNFSIVSNSSSCNQETSSTLSEQSVSGSTNSNRTNELLVTASNQQHYQPCLEAFSSERGNDSNSHVSSQQSVVASSHENIPPEQSIVVASSHQSLAVASSHQSVTVASSHQAEPSSQATCSHTVTTTHAGHKRARDVEGDASSHTDDAGKDHLVSETLMRTRSIELIKKLGIK